MAEKNEQFILSPLWLGRHDKRTTAVTETILSRGFDFISFCTTGQTPICFSLWYTHYFRGTLGQHDAAVSPLGIRENNTNTGWHGWNKRTICWVWPRPVWLNSTVRSTKPPKNKINKCKVGTAFSEWAHGEAKLEIFSAGQSGARLCPVRTYDDDCWHKTPWRPFCNKPHSPDWIRPHSSESECNNHSQLWHHVHWNCMAYKVNRSV